MRGAHVGIEDVAHEDGGHASASRARARERSRGCAHGWLLGLFVDSNNPFLQKATVHSQWL
jgi:hypothetical protein